MSKQAEKLTAKRLEELRRSRPPAQRTVWDSGATGLCVLVSPGRGPEATVSWRVVYYLPSRPGKPHYLTLGRYPEGEYAYKDDGKEVIAKCDDLDAIRDAANIIRSRAKRGVDPKRPVAPDVFDAVVADFLALHASKNRSAYETRRIFRTYVVPVWGNKVIGDIKRSDVTKLLDQLELKKFKGKTGEYLGGRVTADAVLAQLRKLFNWHMTRVDEFHSPIVKGMGRAKPPKERARKVVLSDVELRVMWPILGGMGAYGAAVKCMLLTAQRAQKVAHMRRAEIRDGVWDAGGDNDPKNKQVSVVPLPKLVREIIAAVPIIDAERGMDYVFTVNGRAPLNGWSKYKERLDGKMEAALKSHGIEFRPWQLRDLRRTARTLMAKAGISTEVAEHALGHELGLVRGTYDRHDYLPEKRAAFERLAQTVAKILQPPKGKVGRRRG
jgi:Phage integrase family/Arm DNA-binding domain